MFFDAGKAESALGAVLPAPAGEAKQNRNLSPKQFGPKSPAGNPTEGEAGAGAEGAAGAGAGEAAAGGAAVEELAPLLLLA